MATAIYPGTFDPITNGHVDIATRAASLFERVIVAVYDRPLKNLLFSKAERVAMTQEAVQELPNVLVQSYSGLTVHFARSAGARVIVRGLRALSDFELEFQMALTNRKLAPEMETLFMMPKEQHSYISSSTVREVARLGGEVGDFVPPAVRDALVRTCGR